MADGSTATTTCAAMLMAAHAVRWVDTDCCPWIVEVAFQDAAGARHSIIDKEPLFAFAREPNADTVLPAPVWLDCTVLGAGRPDGRIRVALQHRSVNDDGYAEFTVLAHQVTQCTGETGWHIAGDGTGVACPLGVAKVDG